MMLKRIGAAIGVGALLAAFAQTPAHAAAVSWWTFNSFDSRNTQEWAIRGGSNEPAGTDVIEWQMDTPDTQDHAWTVVFNSDNTVSFRNGGTANWYAISVAGNSKTNGAHLVQWWFDPSNAYERWIPLAVPGIPGYEQYQNVGSRKCIGVSGTNGGTVHPGNGAQIVQWTCGNGDDQDWYQFPWQGK